MMNQVHNAEGPARRSRRGGSGLLRHQRVHRTIELTAFVDRDFPDVVEIVERHASQMLEEATMAAGARTSALMQTLARAWPW